MANHKSSEKRAKQDEVRRMANKMKTTKTRTAIKAVKTALEANDKKNAQALLLKAQSLLSKLAKSSAMSKKTAGRRTSRIASQVAAKFK